MSSCSLCGESRQDEVFLRTHRFRTSESGSATSGYPLCTYCLGRVRSTCDFLGFLRIVKDGHWRADDEDAEKAAWEESVRLREQMFWSRIGGGVVPMVHGHSNISAAASPRPSQEIDADEVPRLAVGTEQPAEPLKDLEEIRLEVEDARAEDMTPIPLKAAEKVIEPTVTSTEVPKEDPPTNTSPEGEVKRLSVTIPQAGAVDPAA